MNRLLLSLFCLVNGAVGVSETAAASDSHIVGVTAVPSAISADGNEAIFDVIIDYGNSIQVVLELHATPTSLSTVGGGPVPPLDHVPIFGAPATGGSWGPGPLPPIYPGGPGFIIQGNSEMNSFLRAAAGSSSLQPDDNSIQNGGAVVVIGAGVCAAIHFGMPFVHRKICGEQGIAYSTPGVCGYGSLVACYEPPPPPPPQPPPVRSGGGWAGGASVPWSPPSSWGWGPSGSVTIRDVDDEDD